MLIRQNNRIREILLKLNNEIKRMFYRTMIKLIIKMKIYTKKLKILIEMNKQRMNKFMNTKNQIL